MTGYGRAAGASGKLLITIELRSVNNRFLDCSVKMPRAYAAVEERLKKTVQAAISRGKLDVFVTVDASQADDVELSVNEALAEAYVKAIRETAARFGLPDDSTATTIVRMPDVLNVKKREADMDALGDDMDAILREAIADFDAMRLREGEKLERDVLSRLGEIERLTGVVEERSPQTVAEYRERLLARMNEVLGSAGIDENRILTEAAIFADRTAVAEETVRLRSHIAQFREIAASGEPVGRKLDFLIQEFNREANTIGSKANDAELARTVVDMKAEIEKIREQIQNIE